MVTGQWLDSHGTRWWYDSGALSLDFAHTGLTGGPEHWEQLRSPDDLAAWLAERFERLAADATDRDLADARALRAAIYRLARAQADGTELQADDVDTVNLFAATPDIPPAIDGGHRQAGRARVRTGQALSTIARDAVHLITHNDHGRIRECDADNCTLVFYDESRTNNRRWCSMQRCGNRAKVRAFREKEKQ
jgi:predicted RNA-binding Zn ribbon-like protein